MITHMTNAITIIACYFEVHYLCSLSKIIFVILLFFVRLIPNASSIKNDGDNSLL